MLHPVPKPGAPAAYVELDPALAQYVWQVFTWTFTEGRTIHFNIPRARALIAATPREVEGVDPEPLRDTIERGAVEINWDHVRRLIDKPFAPVIVAQIDGQSLLIDGWHRMALALMARLELVPAYILTEEETAAVLMTASEYWLWQHGGIPLERAAALFSR